jgi:hypothetical protein
MAGFVIVMPVGPGDEDAERAVDSVAAALAWEPQVARVVLVDDSTADRGLAERIGDPRVVALRNPRRGFGQGVLAGTCTGMLLALRWIADDSPGSPVLRLDTDALVIGPFADRLREALAAHPEAGIVGRDNVGSVGDWRRATAKMAMPVRVYRRPPIRGQRIEQALTGRAAGVRRLVKRARRNGYGDGHHVLAAAFAIRPELVARMAADGILDDPFAWLTVPVVDDVMITVAAHALGMPHVHHEGPGTVFALRHVGLPEPPAALVEHGYAIVHCVKNDPHLTEAEIRAFFRDRRPAAAARP